MLVTLLVHWLPLATQTTKGHIRFCILLDIILPEFETASTLHQELNIDVVFIPFQWRLSFKHYTKLKSTKWGIEAFDL